MFRKNKQRQQPSFFNSDLMMPPKMRDKLYTSWAHTFRETVFAQIPEERFAVLFSETDSRPNAPINVLMGSDILKAGFSWTDEELENHLQFDLQTRYALGLDDLSQSVPTLRSLQNHRRRVREYAQKTGENLYEIVFQIVTDAQLQKLALKTDWQRMDSTQLMSNIAQGSRLELVLGVLQKGITGLPKARQTVWREENVSYLGHEPRHICYRLKAEEVPGYLQKTGELLLTLLHELDTEPGAVEVKALVARVLREQYQIEEDQRVIVRIPQDVAADSLQSPHDTEATYREKNGGRYRGYVTNISETCNPDNPVQLITSIQTERNNTDDSQMLAQSLIEQAERGHRVNKITVDGGYTGLIAEEICQAQGVELKPSRLRGGKSSGLKWGWHEYIWQLTDDGLPKQVHCQQGQVAILRPGRVEGRWLARFDGDACAACPFFNVQCRVKLGKQGATLTGTTRSVEVAVLRQGITPANNGIRAGVEATVRSVKHPFSAGKLPVRGLIRAQMMVCSSALLVNVNRLCRYFQKQAALMGKNAPVSFVWSLFLLFVSQLATSDHYQFVVFEEQTVLITAPTSLSFSQGIFRRSFFR